MTHFPGFASSGAALLARIGTLLGVPLLSANTSHPLAHSTHNSMSSSCDPSACLLRSGAGEWHSGQWQWASEARCCGFGEVGRERARALLRGRSLTFVGDSTARRWLWALVDSVGGMRRRRGHAVPDSSAAFDFKAIALNDSMFDTARAYHAGQAVLLNVRTGRWVGPRLAASAAAACSASVTALPHVRR